jgi:hypothetical protein
MGKVALILGILGILLGGAIFVISLLLPVITDGRTSWDEAMLGIIPGALLLTGSFILAAAGVIVILMRRKKTVASPQ